MSAPLFSIVTIAFQNMDGLLETVESVESQTFRDFEHIVIDAGSTDGSAEWLAANFDGLWVSEPDRGRYHGMNKGAQMARGEYVWFMHSGDVFGDAEVLERVTAATEDAGHPDWLYGLARVVRADKSLHSVLALVPFSMFNVAILGRSLPHQAAAFKRDFFWRLGGYDEKMPVAADLLFMVRAGDRSPPLVMADFVCNFDYTGISATRSWWAIHWDEYRVRRLSGVRVTRWRALDNVLAVTYALIQLAGLSLRGKLGRKAPTANVITERAG